MQPPRSPFPHLTLATLTVLWLGLAGTTATGCQGCKDEPPPEPLAPHAITGTIDGGAETPSTPGPWPMAIALFDEETLDPVTLEALDEPSQWEPLGPRTLPTEFTVDHGAPFKGWVLVVLDTDSSGIPGTPHEGDLIGVNAALVEVPASGLKIYLDDVWAP